jgi:hypothetical protein
MKLKGKAETCIIKCFTICKFFFGNNLKRLSCLGIQITVFCDVKPVVVQKYMMLSEKPAAYTFRSKDTEHVSR